MATPADVASLPVLKTETGVPTPLGLGGLWAMTLVKLEFMVCWAVRSAAPEANTGRVVGKMDVTLLIIGAVVITVGGGGC
jgi:hypothetical protein